MLETQTTTPQLFPSINVRVPSRPKTTPATLHDLKTHGPFSNDENNRNQRVSLVFSAGAKSSVQIYKNRPVSILQRKKNAFYNGNPLALALGVARGLLSTFYMTYQVKIVAFHAVKIIIESLFFLTLKISKAIHVIRVTLLLHFLNKYIYSSIF